MAGLTAKQERFCDEFLIDLNATKAAIRAGYSEKTARSIGQRLLTNVDIQNRIQELMQERSKRVEINQDRVVEELWDVVTADTNDLMELRRGCCRYCWGDDFKYQLTLNEMRSRESHHAADVQKAIENKQTPPEFDPLGGIGYNKNRDPNPDCPECFGEGLYNPFFKDTRKLPKGVKALYAGVKITRDGIEVKTHSKDKYIEMLGRHMGMFKDKVEHSGPEGTPLNVIFNIPRPPKDDGNA